MYFLFKALFWEISNTDEKKLLKIFGNSVGSFNSLLLLGHFRAKIAFCFFFCRFMSSLMPCHVFSALVISGSSKYLWKCIFFYLDVWAWRLCSCKTCIYLCHDHQIGKQREFFILIDFLNDNNKTLNAIFFWGGGGGGDVSLVHLNKFLN